MPSQTAANEPLIEPQHFVGAPLKAFVAPPDLALQVDHNLCAYSDMPAN
jgi:hypothetical protein